MEMIGKHVYIHEPSYHDGETGTVVHGPNKHGQYTVRLDDCGDEVFPLPSEIELIEEEEK